MRLLELHVGVGGSTTRAIVDAGFGFSQLAQGGNFVLGGKRLEEFLVGG